MSPDDIHTKLMQLQQENEQLKKTSVSIDDVEKLIEENRKMKLEIYKLQVTQYGHSEYDNTDSKSEFSMNSNPPISKTNINDEVSKYKPSTGFDLPLDSTTLPKNKMRSPGSSGNLSEKINYNPS